MFRSTAFAKDLLGTEIPNWTGIEFELVFTHTNLKGETEKLWPALNSWSNVFLLVRRSFFLNVNRGMHQKYKSPDGIVKAFGKNLECY